MWCGKPRLSIVAGLLFCTAPAFASELGARATARGGVGFADAGDAAAEEWNIAASALDPRYVIFAGAGLGPDDYVNLRAGALDSRTSPVALGAGYARLVDDVAPTGADRPGWTTPGAALSNPTAWQRVHLGIGVPFLERRMSVAASARYDWRTSALAGADNAFDFGLSVAGRPVEQVTLALGARNLLDSDYPRITREADLGVRWTPGPRFGVEADISSPIDANFSVDRFVWRGGLDAGLAEWLALRGGWSTEAGTNFASVGVGLIHTSVVLDYGVKIQLDDPSRNWHALDLRVNF